MWIWIENRSGKNEIKNESFTGRILADKLFANNRANSIHNNRLYNKILSMSPSRRMQITDNDRVARVDRDIILNGINKNNFTTIDTMRIDKEASPITEKKLADLFGLKRKINDEIY